MLYGQSSRTLSHDFAAADPAEAMASKPSTCRNMGTWGACTQQVKNDGQPHEPGSLKGFNLLSITYTQKYLDRNPSKSTWKTLKGPEHSVPNCRRNFSGFEFVFLDQSVLNVTIKPLSRSNASVSMFLHWFNHSMPCVPEANFACMWQNSEQKALTGNQLLCFFSGTGFPFEVDIELVSLQSWQDTAML